MTSPPPSARGVITYAVIAAVIGVIVLWTLYFARHTLLILYISGLLAIGLSPAVRWLERRRIPGFKRRRQPRWLAVLVLYVVFLAAGAGVISLVVPPLVQQSQELWANLPSYLDRLQGWLVGRGLIAHRYTWSEIVRTIPSPGVAAFGIFGALQSVLGAFGGIVTIFVLPVYLLLEADSLRAGFLKLFSPERRGRVALVTGDVTVKVSAWLGGQILLAFIIGTTAALGLWLLGVPYFYVLALIAGLGELIPVIGPILAAIPAVLVAMTVSLETGLFTAIYFAVQQFVENHFLVPRVMERQVGVSAVTVITALLIGSELLGIVGALLAVPSAAIVQVLLQEYLDSRTGLPE